MEDTYNFAMFQAKTTCTMAPNIAVIYHSSKKKFLSSSKSSTTVQFCEIACHLNLDEMILITGWSLMSLSEAQKQLGISNGGGPGGCEATPPVHYLCNYLIQSSWETRREGLEDRGRGSDQEGDSRPRRGTCCSEDVYSELVLLSHLGLQLNDGSALCHLFLLEVIQVGLQLPQLALRSQSGKSREERCERREQREQRESRESRESKESRERAEGEQSRASRAERAESEQRKQRESREGECSNLEEVDSLADVRICLLFFLFYQNGTNQLENARLIVEQIEFLLD